MTNLRISSLHGLSMQSMDHTDKPCDDAVSIRDDVVGWRCK